MKALLITVILENSKYYRELEAFVLMTGGVLRIQDNTMHTLY